MKILFHGGSGEVTGSCFLFEAEKKKILVDCGMWQGYHFAEEKNLEPFPFNVSEIDFMILTHAHVDHCGRLPKLIAEGFKGKIFATAPTIDLAKIILEDAAHILERHPLYPIECLAKLNNYWQVTDYNQKIKLSDNISLTLKDAGHILGSAMAILDIKGKKIVFSGDLGNPPVPIIKGTEAVDEADFLICESTYGGRTHEDTRERKLLLASAIYEAATLKGTLMIPAFAMERTQEILYELNDLVEKKEIPSVPIFLDSPLAIKATDIFKKYRNLFNQEASELLKTDDDIFSFPGLKITKTSDESKSILNTKAPKVIIAGSGMCQGGRILHHLKNYLSDWRSQVLIVGYQVQNSLGRRIFDKEKKVKIYGQEIVVKAKARAIGGYSAHADQPKILNWLSKFKKKSQQIFIVHGEAEESQALAKKIEEVFKIKTYIPKQNEEVNF